MSLFQEAAHLNNEGIDALLKGDQSSAISLMAKAIKLMKAELSSRNSSTLKCDSDSDSDSDSNTEQNTHTVEIPNMESSDTIVFNQAVRIPTDAEPTTEFDINIYTSAVVFNLALAHHFAGSSGDEVFMVKAEKLYCMVLKLLNDNSLKMHTALIVKLACINNLSQIRYFRGDYKNAREGLSQVSCFMRRSSNQAMFEQPEIQGLLMNVLLLEEPKVARAA
jgi:hypothetical protein